MVSSACVCVCVCVCGYFLLESRTVRGEEQRITNRESRDSRERIQMSDRGRTKKDDRHQNDPLRRDCSCIKKYIHFTPPKIFSKTRGGERRYAFPHSDTRFVENTKENEIYVNYKNSYRMYKQYDLVHTNNDETPASYFFYIGKSVVSRRLINVFLFYDTSADE